MAINELILLAIDDEEIQRLFERALAAGGYRTASIRDRVALDKALQASSPALVIINQGFAKLDELEITAALLERFPTLPILLFYWQVSLDVVRKALHIGVSDCLFAPLRIDDIIHTVGNSIKRASHIGDWTRREVKLTTASLQRRVDELQKFDTILEHIEDGVIILDDKQKILLVNATVRKAFGIKHDNGLNGMPVQEAIPHPDLKAFLEKGVNDSTPHNEITFSDGRVLLAQSAPIPGIGLAVTLQDISYLKQIDRLKNEFINTVSHDLRSPLTAVMGYVDLLDRVGPVNDQQREFIQRVQVSVENITSLVNDLLELGRIQAGYESQVEEVPLEGILRYSLEALAGLISEKHLNLHLDLPENLPPLLGNPIRLRQMFEHLVGYAIMFSPEQGEISIEMEVQTNQVVLRVTDSGPGIPPDDQPHIFEKFYRASNVPKGLGDSGLGLAIAKSIVDSHHGRIWVESMLGQGSTFTVVLPLEQKA